MPSYPVASRPIPSRRWQHHPKLDEGIGLLDKTFTKVEHPPVFPGGEEALRNYIRDICSRNRKLVKKEGPAWTPATQNGHKVVCYQKQQIIFE